MATLYLYQSTAGILNSAILFSFLISAFCVILFSVVRTRRTSIYGSRSFFIQQEYRAEPLPMGFFDWIRPTIWGESTSAQNASCTATHPITSTSTSALSSSSGAAAVPAATTLGTVTTPAPARATCTQRLSNWCINIKHWRNIATSGRNLNSQMAGESTEEKINHHPENSNQADQQQENPSTTVPTNCKVKDQQLLNKIGLDNYLLLKFLKMLFFFALGLVLILLVVLTPIYAIHQYGEHQQQQQEQAQQQESMLRIEQLWIGNLEANDGTWAAIVVTTLFTVSAFAWIWADLKGYLDLRHDYLYKSAFKYSSRVVLIQDIPTRYQSLMSLQRAFGTVTGGIEHIYLCRDVSVLARAVKRRQFVLEMLEVVESQYMERIARTSAVITSMDNKDQVQKKETKPTLLTKCMTWLGIPGCRAYDAHHRGERHDQQRAPGGGLNVNGNTGNGVGGSDQELDDPHVGPLKMYQLEGVPNLSLSDLVAPIVVGSHEELSTIAGGKKSKKSNLAAQTSRGSSMQLGNGKDGSFGLNKTAAPASGGLFSPRWIPSMLLEWYQQRPRRPRHRSLERWLWSLSLGRLRRPKTMDSIRYYRTELCRLNKMIADYYNLQAQATKQDTESIQGYSQRPLSAVTKVPFGFPQFLSGFNSAGQGNDSNHHNEKAGAASLFSQSANNANTASVSVSGDDAHAAIDGNDGQHPTLITNGILPGEPQQLNSPTTPITPRPIPQPGPPKILPSAFILFRTRAGAKEAAGNTIAPDRIPVGGRILGLAPKDVEWQYIGSRATKMSKFLNRAVASAMGCLLVLGSGLVVSAIAAMMISRGWGLIPRDPTNFSSSDYINMGLDPLQGILAPILLLMLMSGGQWVIIELCQFWGQVSKTQIELWIQKYSFFFLWINLVLIHPILALAGAWDHANLEDGTSFTRSASQMAEYLVHGMPEYAALATCYILIAGLALPWIHLLQLPRLWATLPSFRSIFSPVIRSSGYKARLLKPSAIAAVTGASAAAVGTATGTTTSTRLAPPVFTAASSHPESQTPRQAFLIRQPPALDLHTVYPHLLVIFVLALTVAPLAPSLFLSLVVVLACSNLCYRYTVQNVVMTRSQSGGVHYRQAIDLLLFPGLACPPFVLMVYLIYRQAWVQCGFAAVLLIAVGIGKVLVGMQYRKREELMLEKVEEYQTNCQKKLDSTSSSVSMNAPAPVAGSRGRHDGDFQNPALDMFKNTSAEPYFFGAEKERNPIFLKNRQSFERSLHSRNTQATLLDPHELEQHQQQSSIPRSSNSRRQEFQRMLKRPITIIGQVKASESDSNLSLMQRNLESLRNGRMAAVGSTEGRRGSTSTSIGKTTTRPKSVPVFDLNRYEQEILGIDPRSEEDEQDENENHGEQNNAFSINGTTGGNVTRINTKLSSSSSPSSPITPFSYQHRTSSSLVAGQGLISEVDLVATSPYHYEPSRHQRSESAASSIIGDSSLYLQECSRVRLEQEEQEKEIKYKEIVKALRRASSITSGGSRPTSPVANGPAESSHSPRSFLYGVREESFDLSGASAGGASSGGSGTGTDNNNSNSGNINNAKVFGNRNGSLVRFSSLVKKPNNSHNNSNHNLQSPVRAHVSNNTSNGGHSSRRGNSLRLGDPLSSLLSSSTISNPNPQGGPPSLPLLLIHRESVVAAREQHRIESLYLNPVLAEAKSRVFVWLPSQTEQSFYGSYCPLSSMLPLGTNEHLENDPHQQNDGLTFQPSEEARKVVADAISLADQEIRDLRIVGLTVWLDARKIIWGQVDEEEGPLGRRRMVTYGFPDKSSNGSATLLERSNFSTGCSLGGRIKSDAGNNSGASSSPLVNGSGVESNNGRNMTITTVLASNDNRMSAFLSSGPNSVSPTGSGPGSLSIVTGGLFSNHSTLDATAATTAVATATTASATCASWTRGLPLVGDGLLSSLDSAVSDEDLDQTRGAINIIGGSIGAVTKRPIGYYGRLAGDGREEEIGSMRNVK